jgi:hypothetical protein
MGITQLTTDKKSWLQFHFFLTASTLILVVIAIFISFLFIWFHIESGTLKAYFFSWTLFVGIIYFNFARFIGNIVGMDSVDLGGSSFMGAKVFAKLARIGLEKNNDKNSDRGFEHLRAAVKMLERTLFYEGFEVGNLSKLLLTLKILKISNWRRYNNELKQLAKILEDIPDNIGQTFGRINNLMNKQFKWAGDVKKAERRQTFFNALYVYMIPVVVIIVALLSEEGKTYLYNIFRNFDWLGIFGAIVLVVLYFVFMRTMSCFGKNSVGPKDISELD